MAISANERTAIGRNAWLTGEGTEDARADGIDTIAGALIALDLNPERPSKSGSAQNIWDTNYINSRLSLNAFFPSVDCARIVRDVCTRKLEDYQSRFPEKDTNHLSISVNVAAVSSVDTVDIKEQTHTFTNIFATGTLAVADLDANDAEWIATCLRERGVPERVLSGLERSEEGNLSPLMANYSLRLTMSNLRSAGNYRSSGYFRDSNGPIATVFGEKGEGGADILKFIYDPENKDLLVPRHSKFYAPLEAAGKENIPIAELMQDKSLSRECKYAVVEEAKRMFIVNLIGIAKTSGSRQSYGRLALKVEQTTKLGNKVGLKPFLERLFEVDFTKAPSMLVNDQGEVSPYLVANLGIVPGHMVQGVSNGTIHGNDGADGPGHGAGSGMALPVVRVIEKTHSTDKKKEEKEGKEEKIYQGSFLLRDVMNLALQKAASKRPAQKPRVSMSR